MRNTHLRRDVRQVFAIGRESDCLRVVHGQVLTRRQSYAESGHSIGGVGRTPVYPSDKQHGEQDCESDGRSQCDTRDSRAWCALFRGLRGWAGLPQPIQLQLDIMRGLKTLIRIFGQAGANDVVQGRGR